MPVVVVFQAPLNIDKIVLRKANPTLTRTTTTTTIQSANAVLEEAMKSHSTPIPGYLTKHVVVVGYDGHCIAQYIHAFRKLKSNVSVEGSVHIWG